MAIYHLSIKIGTRSKGQSAVAASAYRSGTKLKDDEIDEVFDYTRKSGIVYSEIMLCKNAPSIYSDRQTLWNEVHKIEKAKDAQLWREIEVALPSEFDRDIQIATVQKFVSQLVRKGMCADWNLHDKNDGNPHAHIMLTTRSIKENGAWAPKSRKVYDLDENGERIFQKVDKSGRKQYKCHKEDYNDWNLKSNAEAWRALWAECCNEQLAVSSQIDHRSYERQGKEQIPTIHEGYAARKRAAQGLDTDRVNTNREINQLNEALRQNKQSSAELDREFKILEEQLAEEQEWSRRRAEELRQQETELEIAYRESRFTKMNPSSAEERTIYCDRLKDKISHNSFVIIKYDRIKLDLKTQLSYIHKYRKNEDIYFNYKNNKQIQYYTDYRQEIKQCEHWLSMMKKSGIKESDEEYLRKKIEGISGFLTELEGYTKELKQELDEQLSFRSTYDKEHSAAEYPAKYDQMTPTQRRQERILNDDGKLKKLYDISSFDSIGLKKWAENENRKIKMQTLNVLHRNGFHSKYEFDIYYGYVRASVSDNQTSYDYLKEQNDEISAYKKYMDIYSENEFIYDYYKNKAMYPEQYFQKHKSEIMLFEEAQAELYKHFEMIPDKKQFDYEYSHIKEQLEEVGATNCELRSELDSLETLKYNLDIIYEEEPVREEEERPAERSEPERPKPKHRSMDDEMEL